MVGGPEPFGPSAPVGAFNPRTREPTVAWPTAMRFLTPGAPIPPASATLRYVRRTG